MQTAPQNLSDFIVAEVARQGSEENVRKIVEANIEKTIADAVKSAMQSYGSIGEQIKKAVSQALELREPIDVPSYGTMIMAVLRQKMDDVLAPIVNERLSAEMSEILATGAREVNLEDLIESMKGEIDADNFGKRCTVIIDHSNDETFQGYRTIYLDPDDISRKSPSYVREADRKLSAEAKVSIKPDGTIYALTIDRKDPKTTIVMGPLFGWHKTLFALYATGGKLIVEHESGDFYDTTYGDV